MHAQIYHMGKIGLKKKGVLSDETKKSALKILLHLGLKAWPSWCQKPNMQKQKHKTKN